MAEPQLMTNDALDDGDLWSARVCHFRIHDARHTIFKDRGESYVHVLLKATAYFLYAPTYDTLTLDPPAYRKHKPDVAAFNYAGEPLFWAECGDTGKDKLDFALKHSGARDVALLQTEPIDEMEAFARKAIHYRYLDRLTLIHVPPEILGYVDPYHFWIDESDLVRRYF